MGTMSKFPEDWVPQVVRDLPRVASRVTAEWAVHNKPAERGFLPLKPYPPLSMPEHIIHAAQEKWLRSPQVHLREV